MINTLWYSVKQGAKNLYKNRMFTLASIGTMVACLFLFGVLIAIGMNFRYMVKNAEEQVGITVFFNEGMEEAEIQAIGTKIKNINGVVETNYISAEEAWKTFSEEVFGNEEEVLNAFGTDNPLADSASYEVFIEDIAQQQEIVKQIEQIDGVRKVESSEGAAVGLTNLNMLAGYAAAGVVIILLAVAVFLISNTITIGIAVRKEEIAIMKLIGATDFFVKAPFIIEGLIIGLVGSVIPIGILYAAYDRVIHYVAENYRFLQNILTFLPPNEVLSVMAPASLLIGVGVGFLGSYITLYRHLRV
ncbi:MAG TPA: ABC transporter permease [Lachnospiraceae bacterium]|jgi:cell division transport system permease protein|nr:ABC transporter permease [Lachnospiraceae bacterium]HIS62219.1 ABC transporter permease [Candidatus Scybalomonas excrementigallinarum]